MKKFAFIDYHNTDGTTKKLHGFEIDWIKLYEFLTKKWKCGKVFLYIGIDEGDTETIKWVEDLKKIGCIVKDRTVFAYKNKDKNVSVVCSNCGNNFIKNVDMGYNRKSNCDVDLTVDSMELGGTDTRHYIFSGDGDFSALIQNITQKGSEVYIVSSAKKIQSGPRYYTSRYSTRLRELFSQNNDGKLQFVEINNLKLKIEKT